MQRVLFGVVLIAAVVMGCSKPPASNDVVLYTSCDEFLARPIVEAFEKETGLRVKMVGDTEATKTTGLVERLFAERGAVRADVWWSNEMLGTAQLAEAGLLEAFEPGAEGPAGGWPTEFKDAQGRWYGMGLRARVIAFNTNRIKREQAPTRLADLADPKYKGLVGMARPQFGTTRMQMAALAARSGPDALKKWLTEMKANGVRLYDGNSAVVRGLALGEIEVGLTDTDDALGAKSNGDPVDFLFEAVDEGTATGGGGLRSGGPLLIPNTVALIKGRPNPQGAARLAGFLLSAKTEEMLAGSESKNVPIRPELRARLGMPDVPRGGAVMPGDLVRAMPGADGVVREVLGGS